MISAMPVSVGIVRIPIASPSLFGCSCRTLHVSNRLDICPSLWTYFIQDGICRQQPSGGSDRESRRTCDGERGRAAAARGRQDPERFDFSVWFWGDAIAVDGLLEASELLDARNYQSFALRFFERWLKASPSWTDYLTPGPALLRLHQRTGREDLLNGAKRLANWYRETIPQGPGGVHYYRPDIPQFRTMVIIDSLYHVVPFFALLGRVTKRRCVFRRGLRRLAQPRGLLEERPRSSALPTISTSARDAIAATAGVAATAGRCLHCWSCWK